MLARMWRKGNNPILMVGIYIGIATVENSMKFLKRIKKKKKVPYDPEIQILGIYSKKRKTHRLETIHSPQCS